MSTLLLKHSLLLTHGTVYGQIDALSVHALSPKSVNIDQWNDPAYDWKRGLFERLIMSSTESGTATDNAPIDFIHWATTGTASLSPMEPWRNCTKLLRHI